MNNLDQRISWTASVACALMVVSALAVAQTVEGVPSQAEIGRQLKLRGLPTLGNTLAPAPGPGPAVVPANVPSAPRSSYETGRRPVSPVVSPSSTTPVAPP